MSKPHGEELLNVSLYLSEKLFQTIDQRFDFAGFRE
jgi:hypothetical protein